MPTNYLTPYTQSHLCENNPIFRRIKCIPQIVPYTPPAGTGTVIQQNTIVSWEIVPNSIQGTCTFQLQRGRTEAEDSWVNVGEPTTLWFAIDTEQTRYGMSNTVFYRIVCTSDIAGSIPIISEVIQPYGGWSYFEYRTFVALARREKVRMQGKTGVPFVLFKRRWYGTTCPYCTDVLTGATTNGNCTYCYGTKFVSGYYAPIYCVWGEISPMDNREMTDDQGGRGTANDQTVQSRFFAEPELCTNDIIVNMNTSERFAVQQVKNAAELRGVATLLDVELKLLPPTDPAYLLYYDSTRTCKRYGNLC